MNVRMIVEKVSTRFVCILFLIILIPFFVVSMFTTSMLDRDFYTYYVPDVWWVNLMILIVTLALVIAANYWKKKITLNAKFLTWLLIAAVVGVSVIVLILQWYPRYDQLSCWEAAMGLVNGDYSAWQDMEYCVAYPFQNGYVLFCSIFAAIFGKYGFMIIEVINVICVGLMVLFSVRTMKRIWNVKETAYLYGMSLFLFLPLVFYVTYIYGIIPGLALSMMSIDFLFQYMKTNRKRYIILSMICIAFAVLLKKNYLIILIAIMIVLFLHMLKQKKWILFLVIPCFLLSYYTVNFTANTIIEHITETKTSPGFPTLSWVAMGLQEGDYTIGWYNDYPWSILSPEDDGFLLLAEESKEEVLGLLRDFKEMPDYAFQFFSKKVISQWNNPTFDSLGIYQSYKNNHSPIPGFLNSILLDGNSMNLAAIRIMDLQHLIILFGCILYMILYWKKIDFYQLIFIISFIGGFLFHIVWEGQTQYSLAYFVLLIPYAWIGYKEFADRVVNEIHSKERKIDQRIKLPMPTIIKIAVLLIGLTIIGVVGCKVSGYSDYSETEKQDYMNYCEYVKTNYK